MRKSFGNNGLRRPETAAYLCVGGAAVFVLALTFGAFEGSDNARRLAANEYAPAVISAR